MLPQDASPTQNTDTPPPFVGYEIQMQVAEHFADEAQRKPCFVCAFGYPGVGKSSFASELFRRLEQRTPRYATRIVHCDWIAPLPLQEAILKLDQVAKYVHSSRRNPQGIWLDELDLLAPHLSLTEASRSLITSSGIRIINQIQDLGFRALVLAGTNYPTGMDTAVKSRMCLCIYFEPPSSSVLEAIAMTTLRLDSQSARVLVARYMEKAAEASTVPMTRPFKIAINEFLELCPGWCARNAADLRQLADDLQKSAVQPPKEDFEEWEERERQWIDTWEGYKAIFLRARIGGQS